MNGKKKISTLLANTTKINAYIKLIHLFCSIAQFGVTKDEAVKAATGEESLQGNENSEQLTTLTEQDAHDIRAVIEAAGEDPQTIQMIARLKDENVDELDELRKLPIEEVMNGLKSSLDEMKMLDILFEDPERALMLMEEEGLLPKEHVKKYKKDPQLLEEDTRKALYFRFISLAVVSGYL